MNKLIISTIGTSLLTNQINRANPDEKTWYSQLRDAANLSETETPIETRNIIQKLRLRAIRQLQKIILIKIKLLAHNHMAYIMKI